MGWLVGWGFTAESWVVGLKGGAREGSIEGEGGDGDDGEGDVGIFCRPKPAWPSLPPIATNEVLTRLSGLGPGLSSRELGGRPGEWGAGAPFSNMARRFLTPPPPLPPPPAGGRGAPPMRPVDSGEAIATSFLPSLDPESGCSNFEMMSEMASEFARSTSPGEGGGGRGMGGMATWVVDTLSLLKAELIIGVQNE